MESIDVYDAIALTIHANGNEIKNKLTLQKLIYLEDITLNLDLPRYTHYFYGPYNRNISKALKDMSQFSFIEQNVVSNYYDIHKYSLTKSGIEYAVSTKNEYPKEYKKISEIVKTCKDYCKLELMPLAYAAKSHYILENSTSRKTHTTDEIKTTSKCFGWNVSENDAKTGVKLLQKLNLVYL